MKHYFYLFLALCIGAVVMSCRPSNEPEKPDRPHLGETKINTDSPVGTIGMLDGREGMVVDLGNGLGRVVIATMNVGATATTGEAGYGDYISYDDAVAMSQSHSWGNGWYLPSKDELEALSQHLKLGKTGGYQWPVTSTSILYFPRAGEYNEKGNLVYNGSVTYIASCTEKDSYFWDLELYPDTIELNGNFKNAKVSVRLFHRLFEPVDLGLPSGTKWASVNIGANVPWETGKYFAWGETIEKPRNYYWDNYFDTDDGGNTFKKYNITGGKTTLDLEDDAAHANWGGDWRMPTSAEWDELLTECSWQYAIINDVAGVYVMGSTGNFIFLRGTGWYSEDNYWVNDDWVAHYWSSTINEGNSAGAHYLDINPRSYQKGYASRHWGQPVRAVQSAK